jgi:hypothetical protein
MRFWTIFLLSLMLLAPASVNTGPAPDSRGAPAGWAWIDLKHAPFSPARGEPPIPVHLQAGEENRVKLMQVSGPMPSRTLEDLMRQGVIFLGYIPDCTYVIYLDPDKEDALLSRPEVTWLGDYHPAYKIQQGLFDLTGSFEINLVLFKNVPGRMSREQVLEAIGAAGGEVTSAPGGSPVIRAVVPGNALPRLAAQPQVQWMDRYSEPVALMDNVRIVTGANQASKGGFCGQGIVGEVKDNGCDYKHREFATTMIGFDGSPRVDDHGTCTFGIVFSAGTHDAKARGMMPCGEGIFCTWMVARYQSMVNLTNTWGGVFQSNSWHQGDYDGTYSSYSQEDDQAIIDTGASMLYAAGNSGVEPGSITQDACAKNVFGVGAIFHKNDSNMENDEWLNGGYGNTPGQGPSADNRIKPDICAPFDTIYTTDVSGGDGYSDGDYYGGFGGTSAATPIVAGAVGVTYQMYRDNHFGNNPGGIMPDNATVKALIINHAHQYEMARASRFQQGWGLAQVGRIYRVGSEQIIMNGHYPIKTGEEHVYTFRKLADGEPLKITLVWDDVPGMSSASRALVNDIDLKVITPEGLVYTGNAGLIGSHYSSPSGTLDRANNVENVFLDNPPDGDFLIEVQGRNIAMDNHADPGINQKYSLVVSRAEMTQSDREPFLVEPSVDPLYGYVGQKFEYAVTYLDADGDAPQTMSVVINGEAFPMTLSEGAADDGTYRFTTRDLPQGGGNRYYFYTEDATGRPKRHPLAGVLSGPTVYAPSLAVSGEPAAGGEMTVEIYGVPRGRWACAWSSEGGPWSIPAAGLMLDIGPGDVHVAKGFNETPLQLGGLGYGTVTFTLPADVTPGTKYIQAVTMSGGIWAKTNQAVFVVE